MTLDRFVKFAGVAAVALIVAAPVLARDGKPQRGVHAPRTSQPHTRTTERQRTENGHTRSDTWTRADGKTATRDMTVARDKDAGTVTRESNYTTFDGREGSKSVVTQRTEDGFSRDTTRLGPNGQTHTRAVDVSCVDKKKCIKQVEVDRQP